MNEIKKEIIQLLKDFYSDRDRHNQHASPFESTEEIYQKHADRIAEKVATIAPNIIVDLYEMRASTVKPAQARKMEKVEDLFQYNFLNAVIAQLSSKYSIGYDDIKNIIRERLITEDAIKQICQECGERQCLIDVPFCGRCKQVLKA